MGKIYVIGHRNPDTDSVVSSIVYGDYLKKKKINAVSAVVGKTNKETDLALRLLKEKKPKNLAKAGRNEEYYLVDHNALEQSLPGIKEENILGFVDHHQLAGIKTPGPIFCRCEPVGSTSSVIFKMFQESKMKLTKRQASLLLCGIISDTLRLTSPTTTEEDKKIVRILSKETGIGTKELSERLFRAKSDVSGMSARDIVKADYKEYVFSGKKVGIGIYETVLPSALDSMRSGILKEMEKIKNEDKIDLIFFALIDILKKECFFYLISAPEKALAEKVFKGEYKKDGTFYVPGIVSRKKQITPGISKKI